MLDLDINDAEQGVIQGHQAGYIRSIAISQILILKELQRLNKGAIGMIEGKKIVGCESQGRFTRCDICIHDLFDEGCEGFRDTNKALFRGE